MDMSLNEKGGKNMRKRQGKKSAYILGLLALGAFALTFQCGVVDALAQQDTDLDGFIESGSINVPAGMSLAAYPNDRSLSICAAGIPRDKCMDPATQDLFVIIKRATSCPTSTICGGPCAPSYSGSDIPIPSLYSTTFDPLALVRAGLGVTTHELIQTSGTQFIQEGTAGGTPGAGGGWYAVKIVENLDPCSNYMGLATFGVPYAGSVATVYPEKIKNWIAQTCSVACITNSSGVTTCYRPNDNGVNTFTCKNANSSTSVNMKSPDANLVAKLNGEFIQNVINHEVSHMINLASGTGTSADHHYPIAQGIVMEQFISSKVTKDRSNNIVVTLYISTGYSKQDKTQHRLE